MGRRGLIIAVIAVVGGIAIAIALIARDDGDSQAGAQEAFCSSLSALDSSVQALQALEPTTASKEDYESAVSQIEDDWDEVKKDASELADVTTSDLDDAWDDFKSAVDDVPDDASVSDALGDVASSAQTFGSTVQATLTGPDCASS
jgi:hypothetical protein